jgi:oligoribonuclease NrnB/cAMP/cGMP phosphodiesterase (DHH superfamily)
MEKPIVCLYHKDCIDGTAAAAVVLRKFPHAQTIALGHNHSTEELALLTATVPKEADVYLVDTTCGLEMMMARRHTITILDHHIGEYERVRAVADQDTRVTYVFDNEKSGASLTWSHFFPNEPLPQLLVHVEDKDLWLKRYGDTTEYVTSCLSLIRNNPAQMRELFDAPIETIYEQGAILTQVARADVERLVRLEPITINIGTYEVLAFNITDHESTCGNILSERLGQTVAMYTVLGARVRFSFRSQQEQKPSSLDLAQILGGGGHKNAAGATISLVDFIRSIKQ